MLIFHNSATTSQNKHNLLLREVQNIFGKITSVDISYIHFVKCRTDSSERLLQQRDSVECRILSSLLEYGYHDAQKRLDAKRSSTLYVVPRLGTVSTWSSKATDIAVICKLGEYVERL